MLINIVKLSQLTPFPIELGQKLEFRVTPVSGHTYDPSASFNIFLDNDVIGSRTVTCKDYTMQDFKGIVGCDVGRGSEILLKFTPVRLHYGRNLRILFYRNQGHAYSQQGQLLLNTSIQLTRQPTFLDMQVYLIREPDAVRYAPSELNLTPPIFLQGSMAKVECKTDGALPPSPITFRISCPAPPRATVEHERRLKANMGYPYSVHYRFYNFDSPPTDDELADRLAIEYARAVLEESRIATSSDNLTLSASLPISSKAHDCSIYCQLQGKEANKRLTVYYQTTLAYLLPAPKEGLMPVGSSMSCYADGFPSPSISLSLRQPLRQHRMEPIIEPEQYYATTSPSPPQELVIDDSPIALSSRIGLRPDEYTIEGGRFTLAYNATVGVELLLVCTASNTLPNAKDFLKENKTITTVRFVVAAVSYSSIGIVVGICLAILLIAIIVILLMVYLRRRQKYASNAINTRTSAVGANGLKTQSATDGRPNNRHQGDYPIKVVQPYSWDRPNSRTLPQNNKLYDMRSSLVDVGDGSPNRLPLLSTDGPPSVASISSRSTTHPPIQQRYVPQPQREEGHDGIEYAELNFTPTIGDGDKRRAVTLDRHASGNKRWGHRHPGGDGPSTSMHHIPRVGGSEVGDDVSDYADIVGIVQPKAYASQLVLKQQQEATQSLLAMHQNKPSVFV